MMNLGYMRRHLREKLKEPDPANSLWTDLTLNEYLNEGAKVLASSTEPTESIFQFTTTLQASNAALYQREYVLPGDFDKVASCSLWNGTERGLLYRDVGKSIKNNGYTGIPTHFYVREKTRKRVDTSSTGMTISDIDTLKKPRKMFGLDPAPSQALVVTVRYFANHPWMRQDTDEPDIDYEFRRGIIEYAAALAYDSDEMYAQANLCRASYNGYKEGLFNKMISRGQETEFPVVKITDEDDSFFYEVYRTTP